MTCKRCGEPLESKFSKEFCSRSCAVSYNNAMSPKRKKALKICPKCQGTYSSRNSYCRDCLPSGRLSENTTLGEMRGDGNMNTSRAKYIRDLARKKYLKENDNISCRSCSYTLHVEVAHIKPIKEFDDSATITEINDSKNLIGLCKNHHWELDNGYLLLESLR